MYNNKRGHMTEQLKEIAYGYWWNCVHCGTENAYGLTEAEAEAEIAEWEEDNADLVAEGETGAGAVDWWYNVTAEENRAHAEEQHACRNCKKTA
jgi:hypothetical protein